MKEKLGSMLMPKTYFIVVFLCALLLAGSESVPVYAETSYAARKINMAGRQRMLTQRLAKAACYIASFSDVKRHSAMLTQARDLFAESHRVLRQGSMELGIQATTDPQVLDLLATQEKSWRLIDFGAHLLADLPHVPGLGVDLIARYNLNLLEQADRVVGLLEAHTGEASDTVGGRLVNIAGRQRMLTQKAAKEFCLIAYGIDPAKNRNHLRKSVETFDQALAILREGDPARGLDAVSDMDVGLQLNGIQGQWSRLSPILLKVAQGGQASSADFKLVGQLSEVLLQDSDDVVALLVDYFERTEQTN